MKLKNTLLRIFHLSRDRLIGLSVIPVIAALVAVTFTSPVLANEPVAAEAQTAQAALDTSTQSTRCHVEFKNKTHQTVSVYWVDYHGRLRHYANIKSWRSWGVYTSPGHRWKFYHGHQKIGSYKVDCRNRSVSIGGDGGGSSSSSSSSGGSSSGSSSGGGAHRCDVYFTNKTHKTVSIYWSRNGHLVFYKKLYPSKTWKVRTYRGNKWKFYHGHTKIGSYTTDCNNRHIDIGGDGGGSSSGGSSSSSSSGGSSSGGSSSSSSGGTPKPVVNVGSVVVNERDGQATVPVNLSRTASTACEVTISSNRGSATPGDDYVGATRNVTIPAGESSASVSFDIVNDSNREETESFMAIIDSVSNCDRGTNGLVTIVDDDESVPDPVANVGSITVDEGDGQVSVPIRLSTRATQSCTVTVSTLRDSASPGSDYIGATLSVTIASGGDSASVQFDVVNDASAEPTESFEVIIDGVSGCQSGSNGRVTILDDDEI